MVEYIGWWEELEVLRRKYEIGYDARVMCRCLGGRNMKREIRRTGRKI